MFSGIIEEVGEIVQVRRNGDGKDVTIRCSKVISEIRLGDSIAVNGVCLTVTAFGSESFHATAVKETLQKTTLDKIKKGDGVNLESSLRLNEKIGGHLLQGHIDCVGVIEVIHRRKGSWMFDISFDHSLFANVVPQGSIAIDGVSLTVATILESAIQVSIIPHTFNETLFHKYRVGSNVNIEFDIIGKYIIRYLSLMQAGKKLSLDSLAQSGF